MPKIRYDNCNIRQRDLDLIEVVNGIIDEYTAQGYDLTLRQVYYQCVARDLIPKDWFVDPATGSLNNQRNYNRLGDIIAKGRMAGLIDWDAITDRTRNLRKRPEWDGSTAMVVSRAISGLAKSTGGRSPALARL